jgi:hypothetical protein
MRRLKVARKASRDFADIPMPRVLDLVASSVDYASAAELRGGYGDDDQQRRADWEAHRDFLIAVATRDNLFRRPGAFWRYEGAADLLDQRDDDPHLNDRRVAYLKTHRNLLTPQELAHLHAEDAAMISARSQTLESGARAFETHCDEVDAREPQRVDPKGTR